MKLTLLGAASALALAATAANATTLELLGGTSAAPGSNVTVTTSPNGDAFNGTYNANGFRTRVQNTIEEFVTWCLDLGATINFGNSYDYAMTNTPFSNSFLDAAGAARVDTVFDAVYGSVDAADAIEAAGFQLALWEVVYDDDFDLTTGDFQGGGNGTDAAAITAAATGFLTLADGYAGGDTFTTTFWESTQKKRRQNLVSAELNTTTAIPVPAAGILMVGALGGLAGLRRRRKAA